MIKKLPQSQLLAVVLLLSVLLLVLSPQWLVLQRGQDLSQWLRLGLLPAALLLLLLLSLQRSPGRSVWLWLPLALLVPQEWFYQLTYGKATDAHAMAIIFETDLAEAAGYLSGIGWLLFAAILGILLLFSLTSSLLLAAQLHWPRFCRPLIWSCTLAGLGWVALQERQYAIDYPVDAQADATQTALSRRPLPQSHNLFYQSFPLNLLLAGNEYRVQQQALSAVAAKSRDFQFGAAQPEVLGERQIYVLVIGETLRPDRLQLNGYARATTPELASIPGVISFQDMVSPWAWTRMSVPVIISRKTAANHSYFFDEKSVVAAFAEAGFRTYWLSTQSPLGVHDSSVALHASEADEVQYLNPIGYKKEGFYDEVLLDAFKRVLAKQEQKQLIVLHTLGSHFSYTDRYPPAFDRFLPSGKGQKIGMHDKANRELLSNAYDNTVLYTDFIVAGLIRQLQQQQAVASLLLVSDHGENIFDGDCDKSGHGHNTEFDYRVGALWWGSELFSQQFPEKIQQLNLSARQPLLTSQTFHTMLQLADIHYPTQQSALSFASPAFKPQPRLLWTGVDFDQAEKTGQCRQLPQG
ncbi:phosphoethanolamine transferase [Rheinheimera texasensis]|uniref:phosphoethanolamine transferase n=1 Tax=Rheinheimera texasensis TaxID=306205 RepID=UPI00068E937C|nr:phosphoethanolamine transferase [Rheinheimera texasensis]